MDHALTALIGSYGLAAIFLLMIAEGCGLPFPSEVILPVGGQPVGRDLRGVVQHGYHIVVGGPGPPPRRAGGADLGLVTTSPNRNVSRSRGHT
jgi:hypothetical protein